MSRPVLAPLLVSLSGQWVAKNDPHRIPHARPTTQDFMASFGLGDNDRMIGFADAQGMVIAAIQGLNASFRVALVARNTGLEAMRRELATLKRLVESLG